jgi:hypothetical protein
VEKEGIRNPDGYKQERQHQLAGIGNGMLAGQVLPMSMNPLLTWLFCHLIRISFPWQ